MKAVFLGAFLVLASVVFQGAALAQQMWVPCKPVEAGAFPERIHAKCASAVDGRFWYFAAPTADPRFAARALSVIEAAQLGDKFLNVLFNPNDQSGGDFGCLVTDCRRIIAVVMVETPIPPPSRCVFDTNRPGCPGYCSTRDDMSCPGYCTRHPCDRNCPVNCARCPDDPRCEREPPDPCIRNPRLPQCR